MKHRSTPKATFVEVIGSIKFSGKQSVTPARAWPTPGFAVNKSTFAGDDMAEDHKLVRSSN
ncbi:MAG: hypothetical protein ABJ308_01175 [Halieaceae bacterium]